MGQLILFRQTCITNVHFTSSTWGGTMQIQDARGNVVNDPAGHVSTLENKGSYFNVFDMGYDFKDLFEVYAGYHTLRKV